jgi:Spy/CpxP family protein refolding chaperone
MHRRQWLVSLVLFTPICLALGSRPTRAQEPAAPNPEAATFEALATGFQQLFNEGKAAGKTRREVLQAINLNAAQRAELENTATQLKNLVGNEVEKIRSVLTASQRETLQELREERADRVRDRLAHQIANLRELNLTDEQRTTLMNIRQEYRPKLQELGNQLRTAIAEEVQKVVAVLKPTGAVAKRPERV